MGFSEAEVQEVAYRKDIDTGDAHERGLKRFIVDFLLLPFNDNGLLSVSSSLGAGYSSKFFDLDFSGRLSGGISGDVKLPLVLRFDDSDPGPQVDTIDASSLKRVVKPFNIDKIGKDPLSYLEIQYFRNSSRSSPDLVQQFGITAESFRGFVGEIVRKAAQGGSVAIEVVEDLELSSEGGNDYPVSACRFVVESGKGRVDLVCERSIQFEDYAKIAFRIPSAGTAARQPTLLLAGTGIGFGHTGQYHREGDREVLQEKTNKDANNANRFVIRGEVLSRPDCKPSLYVHWSSEDSFLVKANVSFDVSELSGSFRAGMLRLHAGQEGTANSVFEKTFQLSVIDRSKEVPLREVLSAGYLKLEAENGSGAIEVPLKVKWVVEGGPEGLKKYANELGEETWNFLIVNKPPYVKVKELEDGVSTLVKKTHDYDWSTVAEKVKSALTEELHSMVEKTLKKYSIPLKKEQVERLLRISSVNQLTTQIEEAIEAPLKAEILRFYDRYSDRLVGEARDILETTTGSFLREVVDCVSENERSEFNRHQGEFVAGIGAAAFTILNGSSKTIRGRLETARLRESKEILKSYFTYVLGDYEKLASDVLSIAARDLQLLSEELGGDNRQVCREKFEKELEEGLKKELEGQIEKVIQSHVAKLQNDLEMIEGEVDRLSASFTIDKLEGSLKKAIGDESSIGFKNGVFNIMLKREVPFDERLPFSPELSIGSRRLNLFPRTDLPRIRGSLSFQIELDWNLKSGDVTLRAENSKLGIKLDPPESKQTEEEIRRFSIGIAPIAIKGLRFGPAKKSNEAGAIFEATESLEISLLPDGRLVGLKSDDFIGVWGTIVQPLGIPDKLNFTEIPFNLGFWSGGISVAPSGEEILNGIKDSLPTGDTAWRMTYQAFIEEIRSAFLNCDNLILGGIAKYVLPLVGEDIGKFEGLMSEVAEELADGLQSAEERIAEELKLQKSTFAELLKKELDGVIRRRLGPGGMDILKDPEKGSQNSDSLVEKLKLSETGLEELTVKLPLKVQYQFGDHPSWNLKKIPGLDLALDAKIGLSLNTVETTEDNAPSNTIVIEYTKAEGLQIRPEDRVAFKLRAGLLSGKFLGRLGFLDVEADLADLSKTLEYQFIWNDGNNVKLERHDGSSGKASGGSLEIPLIASIKDNRDFPRIRTILEINMASNSYTFKDISINLGELGEGLLGEVFEKIIRTFALIREVVKFMSDPIQPLDDLGLQVTVVELGYYLGRELEWEDVERARNFLQVIRDIDAYGERLSGFAQYEWVTVADFARFEYSDQFEKEAQQTPKLRQDMEIKERLEAELQQFQKVSDTSSIRIPFLDSPGKSAVKLLMGEDVTLVYFDLPDLSLDCQFSQSFPIVGPLSAAVLGGFQIGASINLGYDSYGLRRYRDSNLTKDISLGFFIDDLDWQTGFDRPELFLRGYIGAAAELNLVAVKAGVGGGLSAQVNFDLNDLPDPILERPDGRLRADELEFLADNDALFTIDGELSAVLFWYIEFLFARESGTLGEIPLVQFRSDSTPNLKQVRLASLSKGNLTLVPAPKEEIRVLPGLDRSPNQVIVQRGTHRKQFSGVRKLIFKGSAGDDFVWINSEVRIPVDFDGGTGNDTLYAGQALSGNRITGAQGDDSIFGGMGSDKLYGGDGDDTIKGFNGDDSIVGGNGEDTLFGGPGKDDLQGEGCNDIINGGKGSDTIHGGTGDDQIEGGPGNDLLFGERDSDEIFGGIGRDALWGGEGMDLLDGGSHADVLRGGENGDFLLGGDGDDILEGNEGGDIAFGDAGSDYLYGAGNKEEDATQIGDDLLVGGTGNDHLYGGAGFDVLLGLRLTDEEDFLGTKREVFNKNWLLLRSVEQQLSIRDVEMDHDVLVGGAGVDWLYGQNGLDVLWGDEETISYVNFPVTGSDRQEDFFYLPFRLGKTKNDDLLRYQALPLGEISGQNRYAGLDQPSIGAGPDKLHGGVGNDWLFGGGNEDVLSGGPNDDFIYGGEGDDVDVHGNDGRDVIAGGPGNDNLHGDGGNDFLIGDQPWNDRDATEGDDDLFGDVGNDLLIGTGGKDSLFGGLGHDTLFGDYWPVDLEAEHLRVLLRRTALSGLTDTNIYQKVLRDSLRGSLDQVELDVGLGFETLGVTEIVEDQQRDDIDRLNGALLKRFDPLLRLLPSPMAASIATRTRNPEANHGDDTLEGGDGDDWLFGDRGSDTLRGQNGDDFLDAGPGKDTKVYGGAGNDVIRGGSEDDTLFGDGGDDLIHGEGGQDGLLGQSGNDLLLGGSDDDVLLGGPGNDGGFGGEGNDVMLGGDYLRFLLIRKPDLLVPVGSDGQVELLAADSDYDKLKRRLEVLRRNDGLETFQIDAYTGLEATDPRILAHLDYVKKEYKRSGDPNGLSKVVDSFDRGKIKVKFGIPNYAKSASSSGNTDHLVGTSKFFESELSAVGQEGDGVDYLFGDGGSDLLYGGLDRDLLAGGEGDDFLDGGGGFDEYVSGDAGNDTVRGGAGDDILQGGSGADLLLGDEGVDRLFGGLDPGRSARGSNPTSVEDDGPQILHGGRDEDYLYASGKSDVEEVLYGGGENDWVFGHAESSNLLFGGKGKDKLFGDADDAGIPVAESTTKANAGSPDLLSGGPGEDDLYGGHGNDLLFGNANSDWLEGQGGADELYGGGWNDQLVMDIGYQTDAGRGSFKLYRPAESPDRFYGHGPRGTDGTDDNATDILLVLGTTKDDTIYLGSSREDSNKLAVSFATQRSESDRLQGNYLVDWVIDGERMVEQIQVQGLGGNDYIEFFSELTQRNGTAYRSRDGKMDIEYRRTGLNGSPLAPIDSDRFRDRTDWFSVIEGGPGIDVLIGSDGRDDINGGDGNDFLYGLGGNDRLWSNKRHTRSGSEEERQPFWLEEDDSEGDSTHKCLETFPSDEVKAEIDYLFAGMGNDDLLGASSRSLSGNRVIEAVNVLSAWSWDPFFQADQVLDDEGVPVSELEVSDNSQCSKLRKCSKSGPDGCYRRVKPPFMETPPSSEFGSSNAVAGSEGSRYELDLTGVNRMLGGDGRDYLFGGNGVDFLSGGEGTNYLFTKEGRWFQNLSSPVGEEGPDTGSSLIPQPAWKCYLSRLERVWYASGTNANDRIELNLVTERGPLGGHYLLTRLSEVEGYFSFQAEARLSHPEAVEANLVLWEPTNPIARESYQTRYSRDPPRKPLEFLQPEEGKDEGNSENNRDPESLQSVGETSEGESKSGPQSNSEKDKIESTAAVPVVKYPTGLDVVFIDALGGDDEVTIWPTVQTTSWIDAGKGNDTVQIQTGKVILPDKTEAARIAVVDVEAETDENAEENTIPETDSNAEKDDNTDEKGFKLLFPKPGDEDDLAALVEFTGLTFHDPEDREDLFVFPDIGREMLVRVVPETKRHGILHVKIDEDDSRKLTGEALDQFMKVGKKENLIVAAKKGFIPTAYRIQVALKQGAESKEQCLDNAVVPGPKSPGSKDESTGKCTRVNVGKKNLREIPDLAAIDRGYATLFPQFGADSVFVRWNSEGLSNLRAWDLRFLSLIDDSPVLPSSIEFCWESESKTALECSGLEFDGTTEEKEVPLYRHADFNTGSGPEDRTLKGAIDKLFEKEDALEDSNGFLRFRFSSVDDAREVEVRSRRFELMNTGESVSIPSNSSKSTGRDPPIPLLDTSEILLQTGHASQGTGISAKFSINRKRLKNYGFIALDVGALKGVFNRAEIRIGEETYTVKREEEENLIRLPFEFSGPEPNKGILVPENKNGEGEKAWNSPDEEKDEVEFSVEFKGSVDESGGQLKRVLAEQVPVRVVRWRDTYPSYAEDKDAGRWISTTYLDANLLKIEVSLGNEVLVFRDPSDRKDIIIGGEGDDRLAGGPGEDWIFGGPGNDTLHGGRDTQFEDLIFGGSGDDTFQIVPDRLPELLTTGEPYVPTFKDRLFGGEGIDRVLYWGRDLDEFGRPIPDHLALAYNTKLWRYEVGARIWDTGRQTFKTERDSAKLDSLHFAFFRTEEVESMAFELREGNDVFRVDQGFQFQSSRFPEHEWGIAPGDREQNAQLVDLTVDGGPGNDLLFGGAGHDEIRGGPGTDVIAGGPGSDLLDGGPGDERDYVAAFRYRASAIPDDYEFGFGGESRRKNDDHHGAVEITGLVQRAVNSLIESETETEQVAQILTATLQHLVNESKSVSADSEDWYLFKLPKMLWGGYETDVYLSSGSIRAYQLAGNNELCVRILPAYLRSENEYLIPESEKATPKILGVPDAYFVKVESLVRESLGKECKTRISPVRYSLNLVISRDQLTPHFDLEKGNWRAAVPSPDTAIAKPSRKYGIFKDYRPLFVLLGDLNEDGKPDYLESFRPEIEVFSSESDQSTVYALGERISRFVYATICLSEPGDSRAGFSSGTYRSIPLRIPAPAIKSEKDILNEVIEKLKNQSVPEEQFENRKEEGFNSKREEYILRGLLRNLKPARINEKNALLVSFKGSSEKHYIAALLGRGDFDDYVDTFFHSISDLKPSFDLLSAADVIWEGKLPEEIENRSHLEIKTNPIRRRWSAGWGRPQRWADWKYAESADYANAISSIDDREELSTWDDTKRVRTGWYMSGGSAFLGYRKQDKQTFQLTRYNRGRKFSLFSPAMEIDSGINNLVLDFAYALDVRESDDASVSKFSTSEKKEKIDDLEKTKQWSTQFELKRNNHGDSTEFPEWENVFYEFYIDRCIDREEEGNSDRCIKVDGFSEWNGFTFLFEYYDTPSESYRHSGWALKNVRCYSPPDLLGVLSAPDVKDYSVIPGPALEIEDRRRRHFIDKPIEKIVRRSNFSNSWVYFVQNESGRKDLESEYQIFEISPYLEYGRRLTSPSKAAYDVPEGVTSYSSPPHQESLPKVGGLYTVGDLVGGGGALALLEQPVIRIGKNRELRDILIRRRYPRKFSAENFREDDPRSDIYDDLIFYVVSVDEGDEDGQQDLSVEGLELFGPIQVTRDIELNTLTKSHALLVDQPPKTDSFEDQSVSLEKLKRVKRGDYEGFFNERRRDSTALRDQVTLRGDQSGGGKVKVILTLNHRGGNTPPLELQMIDALADDYGIDLWVPDRQLNSSAWLDLNKDGYEDILLGVERRFRSSQSPERREYLLLPIYGGPTR